ncbi:MAG: acyltransferase family protein [Nocardioides sp.]
MRTKTRHGAPSTPSTRHGAAGEPVGRRVYVDNLKVLLIAAIIGGHAIAGYSEFEFWSYSEMKEVELSPVTSGLLMWLVGPLVLVLIPLLFLVAGLLTPRSLERHGPGAYARSRLLRLGVPFAVYVLLIQPLVMYPVHPTGEAPGSYWDEFVGAGDQTLDTGPLWFVGTLLVFSLGYAAWSGITGHWAAHRRARPLDVRRLLLLVAPVAAATYLVRVAVPFGEGNKGVSLNVWEWPACLTLFVLGIVTADRGWLDEVPGGVWRGARAVALAGIVGMVAFVGAAVALGTDEDQWWGGSWHWTSLGWSTFEVVIAIFGAIWVLGSAQRHLDRPVRGVGPAVSRSAYGAFMVQTPVLIGLAFVLREISLPAEVKALTLAVAGVVVSFGLARLLLERVPGMHKVL